MKPGRFFTDDSSIPVSFDRFVGNNARYKFSWRDYDPFRDYNCPQTPVTATSDGMYVQTQLGYYFTVNGEASASYQGTFSDYPDNPWRDANCGRIRSTICTVCWSPARCATRFSCS